MTSRDVILQRIRSGLTNAAAAGFAGLEPPPVPEVWPRVTSDPNMLAERFVAELKAVHGETIRCAAMEEARLRLAELARDGQWTTFGAMDRPLVHEVAAGVPPEQVAWTRPDWPSAEIAQLTAGLITADHLLADTGTCVISCPTAADRLMCYLPPACVVVARVGELAEHLPAAWADIAQRAADRDLSGEFVLVTGPSRTADIEKVLILGVHGPKRLVVLLIG